MTDAASPGSPTADRPPLAGVSAHVDPFCAERLPPPDQWPALTGIGRYPAQLNATAELLATGQARPDAVAYRRGEDAWTYGELDGRVRRLAAVLSAEGLVPGNRVLIRGFNSPETAAAILACLHAGLVAVPTMPLLRAHELGAIAGRAEPALVLTDTRLRAEVDAMTADGGQAAGRPTPQVLAWGEPAFDTAWAAAEAMGDAVPTAATDVALLLFTSGTTGVPKAACHLHRDIVAICDTVGDAIYQLGPSDVVTGTPPLAFAYGFGAFCAFPLRAGACTVLLEQAGPDALLDAIEAHRATVVFTAPTAYRALTPLAAGRDLSSLRYGASAGETLPAPTYEAFRAATGVELLDGIGSTELLHVFLSNQIGNTRPGSTGIDVPGYVCRVVDDDGTEVGPGEIGHLEVRGPTGCLYLDDERQAVYVRDGWNRTGDLYTRDDDGWFWYQSRADDLIVTAGYNVAGPEVEAALLAHPAVAECAVIGVPDPQRGMVIKAFVVPAAGHEPGDELAHALQDHAKATIAPFKYPRAVEFRDTLPKTGTGKIQRFVLRQEELDRQRAGA
ncbi:MAG: AMP-binding protein [Acidimicrobiales bacterium]